MSTPGTTLFSLPRKKRPQTRKRGAFLTAARQPSAIIGIAIIIGFILISLFAPLMTPYSSRAVTCGVFEPPSTQHWLGCDDGGVDVLTLVLEGGRVSMFVGFTAAAIALIIGTSVGILSGYFGGWVDTVLMRITDYFLVIPQIVLMIVIAAVWGPSLDHVIVVIGALMWTATARIVRSQVKSIRERVYVRRVEAIGGGHTRIILRHILPQLGPLLAASGVLAITVAIFNETALAFLGLSDPNAITWGTIMERAFSRAAISTGAWWAIVPAGIAVALLILGCYLLGRAIEDALNPRLKISHLALRTWAVRPLGSTVEIDRRSRAQRRIAAAQETPGSARPAEQDSASTREPEPAAPSPGADPAQPAPPPGADPVQPDTNGDRA
ncbi:peptide/nickel transport system permease protein [Leucobacter luti]|uniref:Peptide/nickel transport system permease protein n=1 Tax=Leucobacter luti TaxID=340320 RepID=A0A4R6RSN4_9MICO|nr:ABC transporter permease [Leucobacter luti]TDP89822.1 peptide/nickel transport system permease protein [Leucobacter luti]